MGKRGPAKTPTAMLQLRGNPHVGNRPDPDVEVCDDLPPAPAHITGYALEAWNYYGPMLVNLGVMTEGDAMAFAGLCEVYDEYRQADDAVSADGLFTVTGGDNPMKVESAAVKLRRAARADLKRWLAEFGLTPASRPDVPREPKKQKALGDRY